MAPGARDDLLDLGAGSFVSLTTFRPSGAPVSTAVRVVRDGDALLVLTPAGSGEVERLRHTPRVELAPCDRRGRVAEGARRIPATAVVEADPTAAVRTAGLVRSAYGVEYHLVTAVQAIAARGRERRVSVRITAA